MVRAARRLTNWGAGPGGTGAANISTSSAVILGAGITFINAGTIVRIRGEWECFLSSVTSAGDGFRGALGIGLASSAAFTAGIASLPTPITESNWDGWMWHQFFGVHRGVADISAGSYLRGAIDSKAMRKVSDDFTIFAAVEVVEIGTAALDLFLDSRMLLKEG